MKAATTAAKNLILRSHEARAVPRLLAEWEHNRFSPIKEITVTPAETPDPEWEAIYDLNSIGLPGRPRNGIAKARFDASGKIQAGSKYRDSPNATRYYLATDDDHYKYWSSKLRTSTGMAADGGYEFAAPITVTVMYKQPVIANKIVVGFETAQGRPKTFRLEITTNGSTWTAIGGNLATDVRGQAILWRNNKNAWTDTPDYINAINIMGVRVVVYSMSGPQAHLDLIQLGARLENDLSGFVEDYDRSFEISDRSVIAPLGQASSNVGTITLSNIDRRFNNDNASSPYRGLIGRRVKLTLDLSYDVTPTGSAEERFRELTMWSDNFGGQDEASVVVSLKDSSAILQELTMPKVFWEDQTAGGIIWQTMDLLGLTNYNYTRSALDTGQIIPYFWPDNDTTAWEQISKLAEGTQTAVYFDEYDVMQIKTRRALYSKDNPIAWNFDAIQNGQKLADIVSLENADELVVNTVDVNYKPASYSDFNNGLPKMETVWEPEEDSVVLRASALVKDLLKANTSEMWIRSGEAAYWPYEASVNIRGEVLRYKGKEYVWRKPGGVLGYDWVYSQEDKEKLDEKSDPNMRFANNWSGKLKLVSRGMGGTQADNHLIKPTAYSGFVTNYENTKAFPVAAGQGITYANGMVTISPPASVNLKTVLRRDLFGLRHEAVVTGNNISYGARIRFPEVQIQANKFACGGVFFGGDNTDGGFYLELIPTDIVDSVEKNRKVRQEVSLLVVPSNGGGLVFSAGMTAAANIVRGQWYDLDITYQVAANGVANIVAYLDGVRAASWVVAANKKPVNAGKFGMFIKHQCKMDVEYLYAVSRETYNEPDQSTFLDLVSGGYASGYIDRQWRYGPQYSVTAKGPAKQGGKWFTSLNNRANYVLDEFGPVVHEIREFEINFDEDSIPVAHSFLYLSNSSQVVCTNYLSNAFGASFTLVNASRRDAVINGEDSITLGDDNTISQKFFVYGRALYQDDEQKLNVKDEESMRINGAVSLTFDNRFIQTEVAAKDLGAWVVDQWAAGSDEINIEVFGNPLIQLGDLVTINFPVKDMLPSTHQYYVVELKNQFRAGLVTNLVLRRSKILT